MPGLPLGVRRRECNGGSPCASAFSAWKRSGEDALGAAESGLEVQDGRSAAGGQHGGGIGAPAEVGTGGGDGDRACKVGKEINWWREIRRNRFLPYVHRCFPPRWSAVSHVKLLSAHQGSD